MPGSILDCLTMAEGMWLPSVLPGGGNGLARVPRVGIASTSVPDGRRRLRRVGPDLYRGTVASRRGPPALGEATGAPHGGGHPQVAHSGHESPMRTREGRSEWDPVERPGSGCVYWVRLLGQWSVRSKAVRTPAAPVGLCLGGQQLLFTRERPGRALPAPSTGSCGPGRPFWPHRTAMPARGIPRGMS